MDVFEEMKQNSIEMNTIIYTTLIKAFAKSYDLSNALVMEMLILLLIMSLIILCWIAASDVIILGKQR